MSAVAQPQPQKPSRKARKPRPASSVGRTPVDGMLWGSDLGSQKLLDDGLVEYKNNQAVPLDPADQHSAIRTQPRAQRVWAPERLANMRNSTISPEGLAAAERFRADWFVAEYGVRAGRDETGIRVDPWARLPFSQRRVMCRQSCAMAATKIGPRAMGIVRWLVLEIVPDGFKATAEDYAAYAKRDGRDGWDIAKVVGALAITLDALAAHYDSYGRSERATIAPGREEGDGR